LNKTRKIKKFPEYFMLNDEKIHDKLQIANQFNLFFTDIGPNLATNIFSNTHHSTYMQTKYDCKMTLTPIDETQTFKIIDNLKSKNSYDHDGLSTRFIKLIKMEIAKPLTIIINQAINTGIFPDELKIAEVIPLFKKDIEMLFTNYRLSLFYLPFPKMLREFCSTSCINTFNPINFYMLVNMALERATQQNLLHWNWLMESSLKWIMAT
jgi:hypothetical protein